MDWQILENNKPIDINSIPEFEINQLRENIINFNKRVIGFFGKKEDDGTKLFVVLADDIKGKMYVASSKFDKDNKSYESLTPLIPSFHIFEREFYEEFGIEPLNHPWLKPLRNHQKPYPFFEMEGEEVHQVAVGPIHAGVIEPGHFRFMCNGEKVYNLEIMLGYQHRGVENLFLKNGFHSQLAESICGDSSIGHNLTYTNLIEGLLGFQPTNKAQLIRLIALEMERIAVHIGDMGAIAGDIAYLQGNAVFGATRTLVINQLLNICGSRFGRGLIRIGGVNFDIDEALANSTIKVLNKVAKDVKRMTQTMLTLPTVISRLEKTGLLSHEKTKQLGIVGMAAKASGIDLDTRFNFKNKWFENIAKPEQHKATCDVYSRFKIRYNEIMFSIRLIQQFFELLNLYANEQIKSDLPEKFASNVFAISFSEGWRGEIIHTAITDENGNITRYKIKDPSFNNWYALAIAVRNNGISDFPLCNKSFDLSYCGNDL